MNDIKVADVGKALELLWGSYERSTDKPDFEGFIKWLRSINGYWGYPLEKELQEVREEQGK